AAWGVKSRGVLVADLPAELAKKGAPEALAARVRDLLVACDNVRFDPLADRSAKELVATARALVPELLRAS
ncbi:MAG TPA: hypothetical protein VHB21_17870, partial [Minicystis sp.]|nr:hypothetical protein [Minicystis sp.]